MLHDGCGREKRAREIIGVASNHRREPDGDTNRTVVSLLKAVIRSLFGDASDVALQNIWALLCVLRTEFVPEHFCSSSSPSAHYSSHRLKVQQSEF